MIGTLFRSTTRLFPSYLFKAKVLPMVGARLRYSFVRSLLRKVQPQPLIKRIEKEPDTAKIESILSEIQYLDSQGAQAALMNILEQIRQEKISIQVLQDHRFLKLTAKYPRVFINSTILLRQAVAFSMIEGIRNHNLSKQKVGTYLNLMTETFERAIEAIPQLEQNQQFINAVRINKIQFLTVFNFTMHFTQGNERQTMFSNTAEVFEKQLATLRYNLRQLDDIIQHEEQTPGRDSIMFELISCMAEYVTMHFESLSQLYKLTQNRYAFLSRCEKTQQYAEVVLQLFQKLLEDTHMSAKQLLVREIKAKINFNKKVSAYQSGISKDQQITLYKELADDLGKICEGILKRMEIIEEENVGQLKEISMIYVMFKARQHVMQALEPVQSQKQLFEDEKELLSKIKDKQSREEIREATHPYIENVVRQSSSK